MGLPRIYRKDAPIIATYDYTDVAEGTGIVILYGMDTADDSATNYALTKTTLISQAKEYWNSNVTATSANKYADYDFDLSPFNLPKDIKGTMKISIPARVNVEYSDTRMAHYFIIKLRKYSDTTESEIASVQTSTDNPVMGAGHSMDFTTQMTVPLTHFKKGEILRVTVEYYCWRTIAGTAGGRGGFAFDPKNNYTTNIYSSDGTGTTSIMEFHIPFRIST